MVDMPDKNLIVSGTTTEAEFQQGMSDLWEFLALQVTGVASRDTVSIVEGVITPSSTLIIVDTENQSAADDLNHILSTNIGSKVIFVQSTDAARPVTLKNNVAGTDKIILRTATDAVLDTPKKMIALWYNAASDQWEELWRNWGVFVANAADVTKIKTDLSLGTASAKNTGTASDQVPLNSDLGALSKKNTIDSPTLITDSVITNAKIANSTLTPAKFANNTADTVFGFNESGVPALISRDDLAPPVDPFTWQFIAYDELTSSSSTLTVPAAAFAEDWAELRIMARDVKSTSSSAYNLRMSYNVGGGYKESYSNSYYIEGNFFVPSNFSVETDPSYGLDTRGVTVAGAYNGTGWYRMREYLASYGVDLDLTLKDPYATDRHMSCNLLSTKVAGPVAHTPGVMGPFNVNTTARVQGVRFRFMSSNISTYYYVAAGAKIWVYGRKLVAPE